MRTCKPAVLYVYVYRMININIYEYIVRLEKYSINEPAHGESQDVPYRAMHW